MLVLAVPARAWQEVHEFGQEAHVRIEPNGQASVDATLRWRIVRGPLKVIEIALADAGTDLDPSVTVSGDDGRPIAAHLARQDAKVVRVFVDEPHAAMRGALTFNMRWHVDLVASNALVRDGATWRLTWSAPPPADGLDGARTTIDLVAAPDPPQPILPDTGVVDDGAVSTLRREDDRDVLELVRPHLSRSEAAVWTVRIDPRALAGIAPAVASAPASTPEATLGKEPDRVWAASMFLALSVLAVAFGLLVTSKARAFASACVARGVRSRALIPLPEGPRALLAGASLAAGVALQYAARPTLGGLCVALAVLSASLRAPAAKPVARGPGRWLALRPSEAFARDPSKGHWLDLGSRPGRLTFAVAVASTALLAWLASRIAPESAWLVAMDSAALLPLLVTGSACQLPPRGTAAGTPWLARVFRRLHGATTLRVAPWARLALDGAIDEVRILVLPRAAMPGLVGVEVGLSWSTTPVGWAPAPELLVRVLEGTSAAARLARLTAHRASKVSAVVGRRPDERVVRMTPRVPTVATAAALAQALAEQLADRRVAIGGAARVGLERRIAKIENRCVPTC